MLEIIGAQPNNLSIITSIGDKRKIMAVNGKRNNEIGSWYNENPLK